MKPFSLINLGLMAVTLICPVGKVTAQSTTMNYVLTKTMLNNTGTTSHNKIDYYDGFGRLVETVQKAASPTNKDIITTQQYDCAGRLNYDWLPVSIAANGEYVPFTQFHSASNNFYNDYLAGRYIIHELSPLNRIENQIGPGYAWVSAGRGEKTAWFANASSGDYSCALYVVTSTTSLQKKGVYAANELFVTRNTDDDMNVSYVFADKQGRILLQREMNGTVTHDTYFVYDDLGNLCYVLPPLAADALGATATWDDTNAALMDYAYIYKYDDRNRCTQKKLPGIDAISMRYDQADRLIFSQDGNQKNNVWTFFFYDAFGRQTATGIWKSNTIPALNSLVVKTNYTGTGTLAGYTVNLTLAAIDLMTVNYYDDYAFVNILTAAEKAKMPYTAVSGYDTQYTGGAKGFLTGTRTYQVNDATKYVVSALYYDYRGRVVQSHTSNHLGGFEDEYFAYTFTGKVKQRQHVHSAAGKDTQTEVYTYNYGDPVTNPAERLLSVTHKLNAVTAVTLATNSYDEVGRLLTKTRAGEQSTYFYNVRDWITQITGTKFNQTLTYNAAVNGVTPTTATYNGNISATKWKAGNETTERGYKFTYDGLNRLTASYYGEGPSLATNPNRYNELVTYNKMGNILTLQRQGKTDNTNFGLIDNLTYNTYTGNQVTKITDAVTPGPLYAGAFHFMDGADVAVEYTYDANGNLKKDYNKKIVDIQYNSLNLPNGLQFTNGNTTNYVYDAAGQKLSVTHQTAVAGVVIPMTNVMTPLTTAQISQTFKTDYCGNVIYENGAVSKILTEEGYITFSGTTPVYHYYLKDHQGNNRVVLSQNGTVEQVNHYYPFGGLMGESTAGGVQPYKYNGKELDRMHGLDLFDYGARHYDAAIGRWWTVDPLAEKYYGMSPYAYCGNNPVNAVDLHGDSITIVHRTGFLGLGGKETLTYESGNLYNADGSAYSGKVKGYLKSVMGALGNLNATAEGASLVSELQNSTNMFTIKSGDNGFVPNSSTKAGANLSEVQAVTGNTAGSTGSGGTIYWNANSTSGGLDLTGSISRPAYIGLGHELGHASDSNQGLLHFSSDYTNALGATYFSTHNGLLKSEWRAVYRENLIRGQAGISLRTHYGYDITTGVPRPIGPRLLTPLNLPINYR